MNNKSIKNILNIGKNFLKDYSIESYKIDADVLLSFVLKKGDDYLISHDDEILSDLDINLFKKLLTRRISNEPIAHIIGKRDFWCDSFFVNKSTLIPRPETEVLIEEIIKFFQDRDEKLFFADFGAGTGCIGLSLLREYRNSKCFFVEKSFNAMKMIKKNARRLNFSDRSIFFNHSWAKFKIRKKLDFIVSNPPYISLSDESGIMKDVIDFEPRGALFARDSGLKCYHDILKIAQKSLKPGGYLIFEVDKNCGFIKIPYYFDLVKIEKDLLGLDRVMVLRYKGGDGFLGNKY